MIGATLGHYRILNRLGAGGMGEVYRARDETLGRDVAIKVLREAAAGDTAGRARLLREARSAAALNHAGVCTIHEAGEADGQAYIAMELVEGRPLELLIPEAGLPVERVLDYGLQMAGALGHAHERGIVHRDLKPSNVMITPTGGVKVLDFGLAKPMAARDIGEATTASHGTLTQAGSLVGTLPYMSPEQLRGEAADARSDVWSLGAVLYEMGTGRRPFSGQTAFEVSSAILKEAPAPMSEKVPGELAAVVARCLEKEPARRYQRGGEVSSALESVRAGTAAHPKPRRRASRGRHVALGLAAAAAVLGAAAVLLNVRGLRDRLSGTAVGASRAVKLAVLPFTNPGGDPQQEYFSDGLTEEMITQLGRLQPRRLMVIARVSAMRYKNTDKTVRQIGKELGVDYVLDGSARREGNQVRVTAELVRAGDQVRVWGESYEREMKGILNLQSDLARGVAASLALRLLPSEEKRIASRGPVDAEAYEAYLKGIHHVYKLTAADLDAGMKYLELALEKDPRYALAYAGIGLAWAARQQMGYAPSAEATPKARVAALKAVELDDTLADAHALLAAIKTWSDWDWAGGEAEYRRAIELNPNDAGTRAFYSHYLITVGRPSEAMPQIEKALELDPFNPLWQSAYAIDLLFLNRCDDAIAAARKALQEQPDAPVALSALSKAYDCKGMQGELLVLENAQWKGDSEMLQAIERGYAEEGYAGAHKRIADTLAARYGKTHAGTMKIADEYRVAGDYEHAIDWLEKAFADRDPNLPYIFMAPSWTGPLSSDPRFGHLLRRMKLDPASLAALRTTPPRA
jgi:TolB-like protein